MYVYIVLISHKYIIIYIYILYNTIFVLSNIYIYNPIVGNSHCIAIWLFNIAMERSTMLLRTVNHLFLWAI